MKHIIGKRTQVIRHRRQEKTLVVIKKTLVVASLAQKLYGFLDFKNIIFSPTKNIYI